MGSDSFSYDSWTRGKNEERERILEAIEESCLQEKLMLSGKQFECKLNLGHIGDHSPTKAMISITLERLREILNG